jgi:cytochrome P450
MVTATPPRPRANRVFGFALELRGRRIRTYERVMREHGDVVRLVVGPPGLRFDLYCAFHPDGVRAVLAGSREGYSKRNRFYEQIAEAFGWGLVTSEGELWRRQRRLIQPLFTRKQTASFAEVMAAEAAAGRPARRRSSARARLLSPGEGPFSRLAPVGRARREGSLRGRPLPPCRSPVLWWRRRPVRMRRHRPRSAA